MLDENQIAAASRILHDHWRAGTKLAGLEPSQRPRDRAEAYAIQAAIETYSTGSLFGWKIAATSEAGQKHINVDGPMAGRILPETVIADGGTASMAGNGFRIRGSRISSASGPRKSSRIMLARICSFSVRLRRRAGDRSTWSRRSR